MIGVVVRHNRRQPFLPTIIVAFDEEGNKLKKKQIAPPIDLAVNEEVRLSEFQGEDLSFLNETLDKHDEVWGDSEVEMGSAVNQTVFDYMYP